MQPFRKQGITDYRSKVFDIIRNEQDRQTEKDNQTNEQTERQTNNQKDKQTKFKKKTSTILHNNNSLRRKDDI